VVNLGARAICGAVLKQSPALARADVGTDDVASVDVPQADAAPVLRLQLLGEVLADGEELVEGISGGTASDHCIPQSCAPVDVDVRRQQHAHAALTVRNTTQFGNDCLYPLSVRRRQQIIASQGAMTQLTLKS
jgi:hypothetical protein